MGINERLAPYQRKGIISTTTRKLQGVLSGSEFRIYFRERARKCAEEPGERSGIEFVGRFPVILERPRIEGLEILC